MELTEQDLEKFKNILKSKDAINIVCNKQNKFITYSFSIVNLFDFKIELQNSRTWLCLPNIFVTKVIEPLPHVSNNGLICISDHQGELFDSQSIYNLFEFTLNKAIEILTDSQTNISLLYDELEGYIETTLNNKIKIPLFIKPNNYMSSKLYANTNLKNNNLNIIDIRNAKNKINLINNRNYREIIYIKLLDIKHFIIPNIGESFDKKWWLKQKLKLSQDQLNKISAKRDWVVILLEIPYQEKSTYIVISYHQYLNNIKVQVVQ